MKQTKHLPMAVPRIRALSFLLVLPAVLSGCGAPATTLSGPTHDIPVPREEQRAELKLRLDLRTESACEERFDLELYPTDGIDLIQWEEGEGCAARTVRIRYLPKRISQNALWEHIRKNTEKAEELR